MRRTTPLFVVLTLATSVAGLSGVGCKRSGGDETRASGPRTVRVAAAADLAFAFKDVGDAFEKKTGIHPIFTFGSTGNLAKQIEEGAKYDLFAAANVRFADDAVKSGACDGATKTPYARGRIAIWSKTGISDKPPKTLADLADSKVVKIAIANPEHAPYGKAAQEAFQSAGVWDTVKPKLVFGENVQQTLQFAQTGNVEAAVVALSLATVTEGGQWTLIDDQAHKPIDQVLVSCKNGGDMSAGRALGEYVGSPEGRAVMKKYGFVLPGEAVTQSP